MLLAFIESLLSLSFPFCHVKHARCVPLKHVPSAAYSAMCSTHLRLRAARQFYIVISLSLLFLYTSLHPCNCVLHNIYNLIFNNLHKHLTVPPLSSGPKVLIVEALSTVYWYCTIYYMFTLGHSVAAWHNLYWRGRSEAGGHCLHPRAEVQAEGNSLS